MVQEIDRHVYLFNAKSNSGEHFSLTTIRTDSGNYQKLVLQSYCNSAQFDLFGVDLNPNNLRDLADELEKFLKNPPTKET